MYSNGYNIYKTNSVNYASKDQLLLMLVDGAVKYEIWRSKTGKDGSFAKVYEVKGTVKSYTNLNTVKGATYYYKVKAVHSNANANSAFSIMQNIKSK